MLFCQPFDRQCVKVSRAVDFFARILQPAWREIEMLKKLLLAIAVLIATTGFAFAQVDVNKADQAALDSVKGIGPKTSKAIIDERKKGGDFKDWADFEKRVKGVGEKSAVKLSNAGLTVNGQPLAKSASTAQSEKASADKNGKTKDKKKEAKK
jgi:competence protein ComEA